MQHLQRCEFLFSVQSISSDRDPLPGIWVLEQSDFFPCSSALCGSGVCCSLVVPALSLHAQQDENLGGAF